jgi:phosphoglycerate kinase
MTLPFRTLDDADVKDRRVLLRVDLNVPVEDGRISDTTRIERILPTIREISEKGGKTILLAHFGRPKGATWDERRSEADSLHAVAQELTRLLTRPVLFIADCIGEEAAKAIAGLRNGEVALLENTRFHPGEEANDPDFAAALAANGDLYVNDAFSAAHRAHASTEGIAHLLPSYAGRAMQAELAALTAGLESPRKPLMAIVGGAKVSTKLELLGNLVAKVDMLVIGGGMANTFLAARGHNVGKSLCEKELLETAREIETKARNAGCEIVLPVDAVVAREFRANPPHREVAVDDVADDEMILDAGPHTAALVKAKLTGIRTLVWNGPFGAFELEPFDRTTVVVAQAAAMLTKAGTLVTVAGGGDTVSAMNHAGVTDDFTYVSTAGGAFLEWMEGKPLPGVEALRR